MYKEKNRLSITKKSAHLLYLLVRWDVAALSGLFPWQREPFVGCVTHVFCSHHLSDEECLPTGGLPVGMCPSSVATDDAQYFPMLELVKEHAPINPNLAHDKRVDVVGT